MSYYAIDTTNDLAHHGILGMKWGVRRYQNEDGSLTSAGRLRYYGAGGNRQGYYKRKGMAKRYQDTINNVTKHQGKRDKNYKAWVKEDPKNRYGQRAQYELERATQMLGGKKGFADAKYAYEHKNLAKYINRDGSLTTAGKLKYWDTNKARGKARMERDIAKDKGSLTTSEAARKKWLKTSDAVGLGGLAYANRDLIKAGIISRQKDPTKALRKNTLKTGKYLAKSVIRTATGRPISGFINAEKAFNQATFGTARATGKAVRTAAGNSIRAVRGGASLTKNYATLPGMAKQAARYAVISKGVQTRNKGLMEKALLNPYGNGDYNYSHNLESTAAKQRKYLNAANKASEGVASAAKKAAGGVKKAAQYSYNTNLNTAKGAINKVTSKKRKRN